MHGLRQVVECTCWNYSKTDEGKIIPTRIDDKTHCKIFVCEECMHKFFFTVIEVWRVMDGGMVILETEDEEEAYETYQKLGPNGHIRHLLKHRMQRGYHFIKNYK